MNQQFIIISGMHRSSTSLITQYLQLCGVALGENLLQAFTDNLDGYFENKTIVSLHQQLINEQKHNLFTCPIQTTYTDAAKQTLLKEVDLLTNSGPIFAYKDPRNCLFLQPLTELFSDAKHILLYRDYRQVIDSLIRRGTDKEIKQKPWLAAQAWINYNTYLLNHFKRNRGNCLLFKDYSFIHNAQGCIQLINAHFNINLTLEPMKKIYKPNLTKRDDKYQWKTRLICKIYHRRLESLKLELEQCASIKNNI
jgi:hypothetical protein